MRDYTQETIYMGIDVHKKSHSVAVIGEGMAAKKDIIMIYSAGLERIIY
ncbi:MAG: hypothetical protein ACFFG0_48560 [Candidatus Thorarchaeota archaeon]